MELFTFSDEKVIAKVDVNAIETEILQTSEIELKTKLIIHKINLLLLKKGQEDSNAAANGTARHNREGGDQRNSRVAPLLINHECC